MQSIDGELNLQLKKLDNSFRVSNEYFKKYSNEKRRRNLVLIRDLKELLSKIIFEIKKREKILRQNGYRQQPKKQIENRPQTIADKSAINYYDLKSKIPYTANWNETRRTINLDTTKNYIIDFYNNKLKIQLYDHKYYTVSEILKIIYQNDEKIDILLIRSTVDWLFPVYNNISNYKGTLNYRFDIEQRPLFRPDELKIFRSDFFSIYNYVYSVQIYLYILGFKIWHDTDYNTHEITFLNPKNINLDDYTYFAYLKNGKYYKNDVIIYVIYRICISLRTVKLDSLIPTFRMSILGIRDKIVETKTSNDPQFKVITDVLIELSDLMSRLIFTTFGDQHIVFPFRFVKSKGNDDFYVIEKKPIAK